MSPWTEGKLGPPAGGAKPVIHMLAPTLVQSAARVYEAGAYTPPLLSST